MGWLPRTYLRSCSISFPLLQPGEVPLCPGNRSHSSLALPLVSHIPWWFCVFSGCVSFYHLPPKAHALAARISVVSFLTVQNCVARCTLSLHPLPLSSTSPRPFVTVLDPSSRVCCTQVLSSRQPTAGRHTLDKPIVLVHYTVWLVCVYEARALPLF